MALLNSDAIPGKGRRRCGSARKEYSEWYRSTTFGAALQKTDAFSPIVSDTQRCGSDKQDIIR